MGQSSRLIIGISGASGVIYGLRLLEILRALPSDQKVETFLVVTKAAELTLTYETSHSLKDLHNLADQVCPLGDVGAAIASGSFKTLGMIIAPCSVRTMSEIATGVTSNLLTRAADVVLKEQRRLVLMVRETPLHTGHLKTLLTLSQMGAIISPPVPAFYAHPKTLDHMIDHTLARVLDLFDIDCGRAQRWGEAQQDGTPFDRAKHRRQN